MISFTLSKPQLSVVLTGVLGLLKRHEDARAGLGPKRGDWKLSPGFADGLGALSADMLNQIRVARDSYPLSFEARDVQQLIDRLHERFGELKPTLADSRAAPAIKQAAREEWAALAGATEALERAFVDHLPAGRLRATRSVLKRWQRERVAPGGSTSTRKENPMAKKAKKATKKKAKKSAKKKK